MKSKNKKCRKGRKILLVILSVIILISAFTAIANALVVKSNVEKAKSYDKVTIENQLVPEKDENGNWVFTTDREFRVMQITDVHQGGGYMSGKKDKLSLNAIATMITAEKPDLVIATGDIAYPVPVQAGTFNNKSGAKAFAALMEKLGV